MIYIQKKSIKDDLSDLVIRKGQTVKFDFSGEEITKGAHHRLYFTCEDRMHYGLKDEPQTDKIYMLIDDSLNTEMAVNRRYCLDMSCREPKPFVKRAMIQIMWPPFVDDVTYGATEDWNFGVYTTAKDLKIEDGGFLRMRLEIFNKREGVPAKLTCDPPVRIINVDIPEGTYDYSAIMQSVHIPNDTTASVVIYLEGENYSGEVYFEEPTLLSSTKKNACPDFDLCIPNLERFIWVGQSLSKKEWPELEIKFNGQTIHDGEVFLRIHRYAPVEIDIPDELPILDENEITIKYNSDYHDTVPLAIREAFILEKPKQSFSIAYTPEAATWGRDICVLLRTEKDNITLRSLNEDFEPLTTMNFEKAGLHTARFRAKKCENHQMLTLSDGETVDSVEIVRMVRREDDNVVAGTSDLIYIDNSSESSMQDYLEWFFGLELGNLLTIRPAYRWGGQRTINKEVWDKFREICEGMDAVYAHMIDGRDLPGWDKNPSPEMLEGKNFLGRQQHERDGQVGYWSASAPVSNISESYFTILQRMARETPNNVNLFYTPENICVHKETQKIALYRDMNCNADMKEGYECTVHNLDRIRHPLTTRHTGTTMWFKYFYQAGYDWAGAETMYSSMEPLLAFTRGAAKAYGKKAIGVHHAVQWATYPHDTEERYRRFMLALYTSYMHGVTEINLEEGYWHLESRLAYHHRFSEACTRHREPEARLWRFISSHTRSGRYYTPIAMLHGRYDGCIGFGSNRLWGMKNMLAGEAEKSWTLMKVFYPLSRISDIGSMSTGGVSPLVDNKPRGFYTGTPRGNLDVMPIEQGDYSDYKLLAFLGYNMADSADLDRLLEYVKAGGTLLGTWAHFSYTTDLSEIQSYNHKYLRHPLTDALSDGKPLFGKRTVNGLETEVCINLAKGGNVLATTDDGSPLAYEISVGEGRIIIVNSRFYPANEAIRPIYENILASLQAEYAKAETTEIICGNDVQYTVYLQDDGTKHYYLTPVDWYNSPEPKRYAKVRVGEDIYDIELDFGVIVKAVATDDCFAWTDEDTAEVLEIGENSVTLQGVDSVTLHVLKDGKERVYNLEFAKEPMVKVTLD